MDLRERYSASSETPREFDTEDERRVYEPTFANFQEKTDARVRPVSSRTYQQLVSAGDTRKTQYTLTQKSLLVLVYGNSLYGDERDIGKSSRPVTAQSEGGFGVRQTMAERRRSERVRGGYNASIISNIGANNLSKLRPTSSSTTESSITPETRASSSKATTGSPTTSKDESKDRKDGEECSLQDSTSHVESYDVVSIHDPIPRLSLPVHATKKQMQTFLTTPGGRQQPFSCFILRDRSRSKTHPSYRLFADDGGVFLLSARRRKKSKSSNYLISLVEDDLARESPNYFGKVRSNFIGTQFIIYDNGTKLDPSSKNLRSELGAVLYEPNILGTKGPRKMTAIIPKVYPNGQLVRFQPTLQKDSIVSKFKEDNEEENLIALVNKAPKWNDQLNAYCLNFKGRVTEASVKNFQLVTEDDPDKVALQFGKVRKFGQALIGKDRFNLDFGWPVSALQAFAICLTSFDNKLACE